MTGIFGWADWNDELRQNNKFFFKLILVGYIYFKLITYLDQEVKFWNVMELITRTSKLPSSWYAKKS